MGSLHLSVLILSPLFFWNWLLNWTKSLWEKSLVQLDIQELPTCKLPECSYLCVVIPLYRMITLFCLVFSQHYIQTKLEGWLSLCGLFCQACVESSKATKRSERYLCSYIKLKRTSLWVVQISHWVMFMLWSTLSKALMKSKRLMVLNSQEDSFDSINHRFSTISHG